MNHYVSDDMLSRGLKRAADRIAATISSSWGQFSPPSGTMLAHIDR